MSKGEGAIKSLIHIIMWYTGEYFCLECPEHKVLAYGQNLPNAFETFGEKINEKISEQKR